jgi:hypothetical protein
LQPFNHVVSARAHLQSGLFQAESVALGYILLGHLTNTDRSGVNLSAL